MSATDPVDPLQAAPRSEARAQSAPRFSEARARVIVLNESGLHIRPCNIILTTLKGFRSDLFIAKRVGVGFGPETSARSATSLLLMQAPCGSELELRAAGSDAELLIQTMIDLFARRFDLEPAEA